METEKIMTTVALIAYSAAGVLEWVKAGVSMFGKDAKRTTAGVVAWAALPFVVLGGAAAFDGGLYAVLSNAVMAWATAQLGYPLLIKLPAEVISLIKIKAESVASGPAEKAAP